MCGCRWSSGGLGMSGAWVQGTMTKEASSNGRVGGRTRAVLAGALALVLGSGCDGVQSSTSEQSIIGGQRDHTHVNVVMIRWRYSACTGTYLGAGRILTAEHCLPPLSSGEPVSVELVDDLGDRDRTLASSRYDTLPDWLGEVQDATNDLARVFVDEHEVPAGVAGMPVLDAASGPLGPEDIGDKLTAVGFGATSPPTTDQPHGGGAGTRYRGMVTLEAIDDHTASVRHVGDDASPCKGDSGGPLLVVRDDIEYLAGVVSEGDCERETRYTRADSARNAAYINSPPSGPPGPTPGMPPEDPVPGPEDDCSECRGAGSPAGLAPIALCVAIAFFRRRRRAAVTAAARGRTARSRSRGRAGRRA